MMPYHTFYNPLLVIRQLLHGKSLIRSLFNLALGDHEIRGEVLDLGSKTKSASYYHYLRRATGTQITFTDLQPASGVVSLNVESHFDLPSESFDTVLAFHLFEHVYHFERAPAEVFRVLRPGGRVLVSVPFLHEYHADPDDFFRFTDSGLVRCWESAGLQCVHVEAIGEGLLTATATKLPDLILPPVLRPWFAALLYLVATPLDRLIALRPKVNGRSVPVRFALEQFAVFEKPL